MIYGGNTMDIEKRIELVKQSQEFSSKNDNYVLSKSFVELTSKVNSCLTRMNLNKEDVLIYYERYENKDSLLAIKIKKGKISNGENYAFIACHPYYGKDIFCNVEMYSDSGSLAMNMANLLSRDIVFFFEKIEEELKNNKCDNLQISNVIFLDQKDEKETLLAEDNSVKVKIKRLFKRNNKS